VQHQLAAVRQAAANERQAAAAAAGTAKAQVEQNAAARQQTAELAAERDRQTGQTVAEQQNVARIRDARERAARTAQEADSWEQEARSDYEKAHTSAEAAPTRRIRLAGSRQQGKGRAAGGEQRVPTARGRHIAGGTTRNHDGDHPDRDCGGHRPCGIGYSGVLGS
jgi:hypothetical protein